MLRSTFSTTTIASSTTMPMASTSPNSDSVLIEKPNAEQDREGADDRDRHRHQRDDRGPPGLEEQHHDDHHQQDRLEQRLHHLADAVPHVDGRVVDDPVLHALGEVLLELLHRRAHGGRQLQRVRARRLEDADAHGVLVVQQRAERVVAGGELEPGHVPEPGDLAVGAGLEDDLAELLLVEQPAPRVHAELVVHRHGHRRGAHHAGRDLHVLLPDGGRRRRWP